MKLVLRLFFCLSIILTTISSVSAQSHYRRNVYGDFFAGMTLASMDVKDGNAYKKYKMGLMLGGNVNYKFYHNLQLQSGVYLIKKGLLQHQDRDIPMDGPIERRDVKRTVDASYIQIPLNIGVEFPVAKETFLNVNIGVFGAYGFRGVTKQRGHKMTVINGVGQNIISLDESDVDTFSSTNLKRWDYGIGGSIGVVYDIFILRLQYDHGLANIATKSLINDSEWKTNNAQSGVQEVWKTRNLAICLGFRF